ncbi:MAG: signal peptidase II [Nitrospirae bacterium]|nr:signal peptidase II [Nitrospirota bacterium]
MKKPLLIGALILALDIITKIWIRNSLSLYEAITITPFFNIVHVQNKGAAFGMFAAFGSAFFVIVSIVAIAAMLWYMIKVEEQRTLIAALMAGAIGNLIDRIYQGYVTDFLDFHAGSLHWPAFNVADIALTVGVSLIVITGFLHDRGSQANDVPA